jgi:hypothetical protein
MIYLSDDFTPQQIVAHIFSIHLREYDFGDNSDLKDVLVFVEPVIRSLLLTSSETDIFNLDFIEGTLFHLLLHASDLHECHIELTSSPILTRLNRLTT